MADHWPPELPTDRMPVAIPQARRARQTLARVGGIASARFLCDALTDTGLPLTVRQMRDLLRGPKVRKLGAGYFALTHTLYIPVLDWTEQRLTTTAPAPIGSVTEAILDHYPRGDRLAVTRWLQQEPGRLQIRQGFVELPLQRWRVR